MSQEQINDLCGHVRSGRMNEMVALLKTNTLSRADLNKSCYIQYNDNGPAMWWTANCNKPDMVPVLAAAGADVNCKGNGTSALQTALDGGYTDVAGLLMAFGATTAGLEGHKNFIILPVSSYIWAACRTGDPVALNGALNHPKVTGPDMPHEPLDNVTGLHVAATHGHTGCAQLLLDKGANLHAKDDKGDTPLHKAMAAGQMEVAMFLLEFRGANVHAKNNAGVTALACAKDSGLFMAATNFVKRQEVLAAEQEREKAKQAELEAREKAKQAELEARRAAAKPELDRLRAAVAKARDHLEASMYDVDRFMVELKEAIGIDDREAAMSRSEFAFKVGRFMQETVVFAEADLARALKAVDLNY